MDIFNNSGEVILSYSNPLNGGWVPKQTKAEAKFDQEICDVYYDAYKAAIHEPWILC